MRKAPRRLLHWGMGKGAKGATHCVFLYVVGYPVRAPIRGAQASRAPALQPNPPPGCCLVVDKQAEPPLFSPAHHPAAALWWASKQSARFPAQPTTQLLPFVVGEEAPHSWECTVFCRERRTYIRGQQVQSGCPCHAAASGSRPRPLAHPHPLACMLVLACAYGCASNCARACARTVMHAIAHESSVRYVGLGSCRG